MFQQRDILYEDNHIIAVNKRCGDLVQPDPDGSSALENEIKSFIKVRDSKPGEVYLGVVHRIDRPVSGVVLFAKSSKALVRLNEMLRNGEIQKRYWAVVEERPEELSAELVHYIEKDPKTRRSRVYQSAKGNAKIAKLKYTLKGASKNFTLLEVELMTGRHHQIRAQLSKIGSPIRGDVKYGASRTIPEGGIMLHSRSMTFMHPVRKEPITITAPTATSDGLWNYFEQAFA